MKAALTSVPEYALTGISEAQMRLLIAVFANLSEACGRALVGVDDRSTAVHDTWVALAQGVPDMAKEQINKQRKTTLMIQQ